ncbi:MAG TPA: hypothetical protein VFJ28_10470 [Marmoricola sp.]|nr:hypothetical protein [Marmoricola sp.]
MRIGKVLVFLVVLAVVVGTGVALWRGSGPLPDPEQCKARLGAHTVVLSTEQAENASLIAAIGVGRGLPARAVSIALATAYQESKIRNLDHGDRDSLGLFQQRPSQGWGTPEQLQDPHFATHAFYDALQKIDGYQDMRITEAAQRVQRSGFPEAYEDHAADARTLASILTGFSPGGRFTCVVKESEERQTAAEVQRLLGRTYGELDVQRTGSRQDLAVSVGGDESGRRLGWSVAQFLVAHGVRLRPAQVAYDGRQWRTGRPSEDGWQDAPRAGRERVRISMG